MVNPSRRGRQKISTTIASETLEYLERLIAKGEAGTLAVAIDAAIAKLLAYENRERLARDTAAYFANMTDEEAEEERRLEAALTQSAENDSER
jgi:hypothetical protein